MNRKDRRAQGKSGGPPGGGGPTPLDHQFMRAQQAHQAGRLDEAASIYRQILAAAPKHSGALHYLGIVAMQKGDGDGAERLIRQALAVFPGDAMAHYNLALLMASDPRRLEEAKESLQRALKLNPHHVDALNNLGTILYELRDYPAAIRQFEKALALQPRSPMIQYNLGRAHRRAGNAECAVEFLEAAARAAPDRPDVFLDLGNALRDAGRIDQAIARFETARALAPSRAEPGLNLANALLYLGEAERSLQIYDEIASAHPGFEPNRRARLAGILYGEDPDPGRRGEVHRAYGRDFGPAAPAILRSSADPAKRLRIGYLSADFHDHPVTRNLLPLVDAHDRSRFTFCAYSDLRREDFVTERLKKGFDLWRPIGLTDDKAAADLIRADKVDILVSLAGRFDENRPSICAHRAAPVQISFHDPATSGIEAMDYIFADGTLIPRDTNEIFVERPLRLPTFYLASPIVGAPEIGPVPRTHSGIPTFGSFNNPAKVNKAVLDLWARLLAALPEAHLLLKYMTHYDSQRVRARVLAAMAARGIAGERIHFRGSIDSTSSHLALYNEIDVALDTFPFSGSTTSFEALWMGVPVVTLPGATMVSRWTAAILKSLKRSEWIAGTEADYIKIASGLAADADALAEIRAGLRNEVSHSPLCDAPARARQIERFYRAVWRRHCASSSRSE